jgi:hypothetical protein
MNISVRSILAKADEIYDNIDENNDKHPYLKAFGCGAVEGFMDAAVMMYIPVLIGAFYWKIKANK